ncbi:hypothetical protein RHMOL_Rhmol08G0212800 [Rhododendron molle]|uniref:Uncharacterized protein n=2 Tax=Rhododendron molle TaxID=49168 RepID=A0ACC0MRY0_RHOML|nr:hypothetical protein RHMOL_Rhmol08G0212800 [Rhododendron molle]KAI8543381.1 hypothetical protein RHMOL_Rhmol08G0212800 [Rhododendron molle]
MSTMSDHQKVTVVPTEKIPFDQLPDFPSKVGGPSEFTNLSIVQTVTTVSIVTVSSESTIVSAGSVPPEVTTLPPEGTIPPKVTTESIVSDPLEVYVATAEGISLNTIESTKSMPPEVTSESIESVPPEVTTLPLEGTVPPKVTTESTVSVPLETSATCTESVPLNTVESIASAYLEVTSESIESVPREETILAPMGAVSPKVTTGSTVSVPLEISVASTESVPLNIVESTESAPPELTSNSLDCIPPEVTTRSTMSVPLEVSAASIESVPLNTVESTESTPPEVTSVATESIPPNATTLPLTSVPRESIVESTNSVHLEVTSESTGSGSSEVTTKPTEGLVPRDVTNSLMASAPSSNPPQLTTTPNVSAPSPGLTVAASSLTSCTPDDQELISKARDDAIHLYRAFSGWGCDEATIVKILAHRSARHRTLIRKEYKTEFSEDFDNRLSKELILKPDLKRALLLWMDEPAKRDAKIVNHGLSKKVAIEVICSRTPSQLEELKKAYRTLFGVYLDEDIESHAHGDNKKLLIAYAGTIRSESPEVDPMMVDKDAKDLFKDGEWRLGTNEETFIRIFSERSSAHLAAINSAYRKMYVNSLKKAVKKETSWKFKCALLTILKCAENPGKYFAKALHKAMKGLATDDETLTRIIVSRAEVDVKKIKEEYLKKYGKSLSDDVHSDTSGQYRAFLMSLLNPNA